MRFQTKLFLVLILVGSLMAGFVFGLSYVLNAVQPGFIRDIGKAAPVFGWEELIDLLQVGVAAWAVIITPGLLSRLSDRLRGRIVAECNPLAFHPNTGTRAWRVFLSSSARHLSDLTVSVYPRSQGNVVVTSRTRTDEDGGVVYRTTLDRGSLNVVIDRIAPNRRLAFSVLFECADEPAFHSAQVAVRVRKPPYDQVLRASGHSLYLIHLRIFIALAVFVSVYLMLFARILMITVKSQN